jgi:hypothetical protein
LNFLTTEELITVVLREPRESPKKVFIVYGWREYFTYYKTPRERDRYPEEKTRPKRSFCPLEIRSGDYDSCTVMIGDHSPSAVSVVNSMIIIGPAAAPQISSMKRPLTPALPQLDWIDQRILDLVHESEPVKLWQVLNRVSDELSPRGRAEGREVRMKLWQKVFVQMPRIICCNRSGSGL